MRPRWKDGRPTFELRNPSCVGQILITLLCSPFIKNDHGVRPSFLLSLPLSLSPSFSCYLSLSLSSSLTLLSLSPCSLSLPLSLSPSFSCYLSLSLSSSLHPLSLLPPPPPVLPSLPLSLPPSLSLTNSWLWD